jgi:hypothetical protein
MATAGGGEVWTGLQLTARLVALNGAAPEPAQHVIFRATRQADGTLVEGYDIPGEKRQRDSPALDFWLARHRLAGADRLAVAVLVIRETLDSRGLIMQCTLERRRGSADGPYCGDPARVEFAGPASAVRLYRGHLDGRLTEIAPTADAAPPRVRSPEQFAGEHKALQARFGDSVRILDTREPTLFEDMIGLASIAHVRTAEGREVGCGIGWHGGLAFVLEADFPRFTTQLALAPSDSAAVDAMVLADGLVRGETRLDHDGVAVVCRRKGGEALFLLRPRSGQVRAETYVPGRGAAGPDQQRWMHYAETYEGLAVLDAWHDGASDDVIVLTADLSGQVWRHHIDGDGVETWRKADDEAAVGTLHREQLLPGSLAAADAESILAEDAADTPMLRSHGTHMTSDDSLLSRAEGYVRAMAALRATREDVDETPEAVARHIRALQTALLTLEAHVAAAGAQDMLTQLHNGGLEPAAFAQQLTQIEASLRHELGLIRSVAIAPPRSFFLHRDEPPFGRDVAACFSSAGYDIEEASVCLAFRRSTAAVFHCMKILEHGIGAFARCAGLADQVATGERNWPAILRPLRGVAANRFPGVRAALEFIYDRWRAPTLLPAEKYTEEEAELIFHAVGRFMRALAVLCDENGKRAPSGHASLDASDC